MDLLKLNTAQATYFILSLIFLTKNASGLRCYQCDSAVDLHCPEQFHTGYHDVTMVVPTFTPSSCDRVFEARYCVKTTGMFEGELGTKRFCSARDWGNYCQWVRRPGDEREYRACVFTCWGDGCNSSPHTVTPCMVLLLLPALAFTLYMAGLPTL